jgi:hypothetical protein
VLYSIEAPKKLVGYSTIQEKMRHSGHYDQWRFSTRSTASSSTRRGSMAPCRRTSTPSVASRQRASGMFDS